MSFNCPPAPGSANIALVLQTLTLLAGTKLFRFHSRARLADSFNPNLDKRIDLPEDGSRFNPFPGAPLANISTLYAADSLEAAALESVFHDVEHSPSPTYPKMRLAEWCYSRLELKRELTLLALTNPRIRQLAVPGRSSSIQEGELVHSPPSEYPNTRSWAQFLHASVPQLDGLAWRPRLGGTGQAYIFFGDRGALTNLEVESGPTSVASGAGFLELIRIAQSTSIQIVDSA